MGVKIEYSGEGEPVDRLLDLLGETLLVGLPHDRRAWSVDGAEVNIDYAQAMRTAVGCLAEMVGSDPEKAKAAADKVIDALYLPIYEVEESEEDSGAGA